MKNQHTSTSRTLPLLFIYTLTLVPLIPIIYILGNTEKNNNHGEREASIDLDIYLDEGCTTKIESINWGELVPGGNSTIVVYIKNRGKIPATLTCSLTNFSPYDAVDYLTLDWDSEAYILEPQKTVETRLTLSVSSKAYINMFNVDVLITGTA